MLLTSQGKIREDPGKNREEPDKNLVNKTVADHNSYNYVLSVIKTKPLEVIHGFD